MYGGRLFVSHGGKSLCAGPSVTRIIRTMSADHPLSAPPTLEDIRAEVLTPDRLNCWCLAVFADGRVGELQWWASRGCWRFR